MKNPIPVHERDRFQRAATQRVRDSRHPDRARKDLAEMLQSVACLVGAGKTVSVRTVLAGLDASRHVIIYLPNPMIGVRGLHEMIVATFGGTPDRSGSRLTAQASAVLAAERDERGKTPVLVIDEAPLLRYEQLETIRMLTNHNIAADSPLAALLVGQPTLRRTMKLAVLAALEQRVALRYTMPP